MNTLRIAFFCFVALVATSTFSMAQQEGTENAPTENSGKLILLEKAKISTISNREIREATGEESEKDKKEDGYLPNPTAIDCFDALGYRYTGGRYNDELIRFRLRCPPKIEPGKKYPLIVWFHGKGESGDDNKRQLAHLQYTLPFLAGPKSLDFFMLVTQCPKDNPYWDTSVSTEGKGDAPMTIAREIMEAVIKEFPIDEDRISAFGLSSGGAAAWQFVQDSPEKFASIVSCSASPPSGPLLTDVTVWAFGCTGDGQISMEQLRQTINQTKSKGGSALLTEINSGSHDSWNVALSQKKAVAWMIHQNRHSIYNPPPGCVLTPRSWGRSFVWFGLPVCCMIPFLLLGKRKC